MSTRSRARLFIAAIAALAIASESRAQCTGVNHVTWPSVNPVWDFCWLSPPNSTGVNGSGVELRDVRYRGTLVLARAHLPILNVKYESNEVGCGGLNFCYRDWLWQEQTFQCSPSPSPGYCTGQSTPASPPPTFCQGGEACTVCDHPGLDAGAFQGVAVEDRGTSLRLTSQCQAGWYRYIPVWEFFADGTIQAQFVATSINHTCVAYTHHHQAYFRFDVDVNGSAGNFVDQVLPPNTLQRVMTERNFVDSGSSRSRWRVGRAGSPYAVEISRNPADGAAGDPVIPDDFPIADGWVLVNNPNEIDDGGALGSDDCPAGLNGFDNNQNVDGADVVLWVRAGALHEGEDGGVAQDCSMVGPTIRVLPVPVASRLNTTVTACRIVDTRNAPGIYGGPAIPGNGIRTFVLTGQCGIPPTAKSVAVNLTVVQASSAGYLTAFPAGQSLPLASTLNFGAGQTRANNAVLSLSPAGAVSVFNGASGPANFLLDVVGWFE